MKIVYVNNIFAPIIKKTWKEVWYVKKFFDWLKDLRAGLRQKNEVKKVIYKPVPGIRVMGLQPNGLPVVKIEKKKSKRRK